MYNVYFKYIIAAVLIFCSYSLFGQNTRTGKQDNTEVQRMEDSVFAAAEFNSKAAALTSELRRILSLSNEQAEEVEQILLEYRRETANIIYAANEDIHDGMKVQDFDKQQALKEADISTNAKIEELLNQAQFEKYLLHKEEWWNNVKQEIY